MKILTWHGPGVLEVRGHFTLARGESRRVSNDLADTLARANPSLRITVSDDDAAAAGAPQPEAQQGEGQSTPSTDQEE